MGVLRTWPDEMSFVADDARRGTSDQVDLGGTWRAAGSNDPWRLAWLRETGELFVCRADGYDGSCTDVHLLAVVERETDLDHMLEGWHDLRFDPDGLTWLLGRVSPLALAV